MKLTVLIGVLLLHIPIISSYGQEKVSFGVLGAYNFPLQTTSFGVRSRIPFHPLFAVSPQIKYAPSSINDFNELSVSANLHYTILNDTYRRGNRLVYKEWKPKVYVIAGINYVNWINYSPSVNKNAGKNNVLPEIGLGSQIGGALLRIFLEGKYNILWSESSTEFGFMLYPFEKKNTNRKCTIY